MPKRKRSRQSSSPAAPQPIKDGTTFALHENGVNVLEGLVLHEGAIATDLEQELIAFVQSECARGRRGQLRKPTYLRSAGARSRGNQREALQYGGFFDFNKARPGKRGLVPEFPPILCRLVDHLMSRGYLPNDVRPDSCIINQYGVGDCIPPHVDHESYHRPISTLSLLGEEPMLVGTKFKTVKSCTWKPVVGQSVSLPRRSLLVLGGNSGNISKHCISSCKGERISITLRKQPPPDWRPSAEEVAKSSQGNTNDVDERPKKKKALSGSAKRRKKMMKLTGPAEDEEDRKPKHVEKPDIDVSTKAATKKKKCSEKQARRNARRLEKKQKAAAEGKGGT